MNNIIPFLRLILTTICLFFTCGVLSIIWYGLASFRRNGVWLFALRQAFRREMIRCVELWLLEALSVLSITYPLNTERDSGIIGSLVTRQILITIIALCIALQSMLDLRRGKEARKRFDALLNEEQKEGRHD